MSDTNPVPDHVQRMDGRAAAGAARIMQLAAESANPVPAPTPADLGRDLAADLRAIESSRLTEWSTRTLVEIAVAGGRRAMHAEARVDELQRGFDLRWKATQRAIHRWRAANPASRELEWPDHADLCCWLLERLSVAESECERLRAGTVEAAERLLGWCDMPSPEDSMRGVARYLRALLQEGSNDDQR